MTILWPYSFLFVMRACVVHRLTAAWMRFGCVHRDWKSLTTGNSLCCYSRGSTQRSDIVTHLTSLTICPHWRSFCRSSTPHVFEIYTQWRAAPCPCSSWTLIRQSSRQWYEAKDAIGRTNIVSSTLLLWFLYISYILRSSSCRFRFRGRRKWCPYINPKYDGGERSASEKALYILPILPFPWITTLSESMPIVATVWMVDPFSIHNSPPHRLFRHLLLPIQRFHLPFEKRETYLKV